MQLLLVLVPGGNRQVQLFIFFLKKKADRGATVVQHLELSRNSPIHLGLTLVLTFSGRPSTGGPPVVTNVTGLDGKEDCT